MKGEEKKEASFKRTFPSQIGKCHRILCRQHQPHLRVREGAGAEEQWAASALGSFELEHSCVMAVSSLPAN